MTIRDDPCQSSRNTAKGGGGGLSRQSDLGLSAIQEVGDCFPFDKLRVAMTKRGDPTQSSRGGFSQRGDLGLSLIQEVGDCFSRQACRDRKDTWGEAPLACFP